MSFYKFFVITLKVTSPDKFINNKRTKLNNTGIKT